MRSRIPGCVILWCVLKIYCMIFYIPCSVGPDNIVGNESDQEEVNTIIHDHDYFKALIRVTPYINDVNSCIQIFTKNKLQDMSSLVYG